MGLLQASSPFELARSSAISSWLWWNLLSLDAPAVAIIWALVFARAHHMRLSIADIVCLSCTSVGYLHERSTDGRLEDSESGYSSGAASLLLQTSPIVGLSVDAGNQGWPLGCCEIFTACGSNCRRQTRDCHLCLHGCRSSRRRMVEMVAAEGSSRRRSVHCGSNATHLVARYGIFPGCLRVFRSLRNSVFLKLSRHRVLGV